MKILVTGATGVIGRRVVPLLTAAGHEVTAAGRSLERLAPLGRAGARTIVLDLFDAPAARDALAGHDVLVNLATSIPPSNRALWPGAWRQTARLRRLASHVLADSALATGVGRMIQEAFAPIYADGCDRWLDESAPVRAARYNRAVLAAEAAAAKVTVAGAAGVVLRFGYFYGPDSDFSADAVRLVRHGWAPAFGSPAGYVSSIAHDDAARAVVAALAVPAGTYNVVDDEPLTRRESFDALAEALGVRAPRFAPTWARLLAGSLGETLARSQRISNHRFRRVAVAWQPAYPSVREGWRALVTALAT